MIAIIKTNETISNIQDDFTNKTEFKKELQNNGYKVLMIFNTTEIEIIKKTDYIELITNVKKYTNTYNDCIEYIKQCL